MNSAKKRRLEAAGWKVGSASDFLGLTPEEVELIEMKLALGQALKRYRARKRLTQEALAMKLGSSQSRIAKLESGLRGSTLDLLFRALFATGATTDDIAREIRSKKRRVA